MFSIAIAQAPLAERHGLILDDALMVLDQCAQQADIHSNKPPTT